MGISYFCASAINRRKKRCKILLCVDILLPMGREQDVAVLFQPQPAETSDAWIFSKFPRSTSAIGER